MDATYIHSNESTNIIHYVGVQVVFYSLYSTVFVLGIFGNILVSYIVCLNKAMRTVTNLFIMNLALSDIILCALAVPFTPLYSFTGKWMFGSFICHLVPYIQASSVYVSAWTLMAIAVDRYFVIIYPFKQKMKLTTCTVIIIGIWAFSMIITLPYGIYMDVLNGVYCEEKWPEEKFFGRMAEKYFGCFTIIMQCVVPFLVIAYCYVCISIRLNRRAKSKPGTKSARKEEIDRERKKRTNRMLISMVTIFGICWLPFNVINVIHDFVGDSWRHFHLWFFLSHLLAMSSTCYNPFLYAWLNENFRKEFKHILPCVSKRVSRRFCNGNDHTQDTLLHSTVSNSGVKCLEPREPTAEKISPLTGFDIEFKIHTVKSDGFGSAQTREHEL